MITEIIADTDRPMRPEGPLRLQPIITNYGDGHGVVARFLPWAADRQQALVEHAERCFDSPGNETSTG